jgi:hypothetical protein
MSKRLEQTPNINPSTAFKILAGGAESLSPRTAIKLLAEQMRKQMDEANRTSSENGIIDFAQRRRIRQLDGRRVATTNHMPPSGQDNYGAFAPLTRREMF